MRNELKKFAQNLLNIWKIASPLTNPVILSKIDRLTDEEVKKTIELIKTSF